MWTSCYGRLKKLPPGIEPVGISRTVPRWAGRIRRYPALAPPNDIRVDGYLAMLAKLDPAATFAALGERTALCCFEAPGFLCHRRMVAGWLEKALGIIVPELGFPRELLGSWEELPLKGQWFGFPWCVACDHCQAEIEVLLTTTRIRCPACRRMVDCDFVSAS